MDAMVAKELLRNNLFISLCVFLYFTTTCPDSSGELEIELVMSFNELKQNSVKLRVKLFLNSVVRLLLLSS